MLSRLMEKFSQTLKQNYDFKSIVSYLVWIKYIINERLFGTFNRTRGTNVL